MVRCWGGGGCVCPRLTGASDERMRRAVFCSDGTSNPSTMNKLRVRVKVKARARVRVKPCDD